MRSARRAILDAVRTDLAAARGLAHSAWLAAGRDAARATAALDAARIRQSAGELDLAQCRDDHLAAAAARHAMRTAGITARLAEVAALAAPGPAGTTWDAFPDHPADAGSRLPGMLRIGTLERGVPALLPLLDFGHVAVLGGAAQPADDLIAGLLLRALACAGPGGLQVRVYDPERLGGTLAGFARLAGAGLLRSTGPAGLSALLDELVEQVRRVTEQVLAGEHPSVRSLAEATGRRPEPWRIAVLLSGPQRPDQVAQLDRLARTGPACGVHLLTRGVPLPNAVTVRLGPPTVTDLTGTLPVTLDPPPPALLVTRTCRQLAAGPPPMRFADLLPEKLGTGCSADGLVTPIGEAPDGSAVEVPLGDDPPHALIGGPSGSGKTNLIYAWLAGLAARYPVDELELYLLDFKEGVSFARFAPGRRDPSWLPQVRLVGVNVNADREFGVALLRHLLDELRRRAAAARRREATKLAELRAEEPGGRWPRIVAVIDEFQVLLTGRDPVTAEAVALLEDLARRGRSQGIHLVLASQDVSGIEALWGRSGLIGQFTLRIALPKAQRILADNNDAAQTIGRHHAVVNTESGAPGANQIVRLPDAGARDGWRDLQDQLWRARPSDVAPPRLFDGDAVPDLPPASGHADRPVALVGQRIDVAGRPATLALARSPGRNLAVLGTAPAAAHAVLAAAARSLADRWPTARFSVLCLDPAAAAGAAALAAGLPGPGLIGAAPAGGGRADAVLVDAAEVGRLATAAPPGPGPHIIIGYALDADPALAEPVRHLLHTGPERGVHVFGWWRGVSRLRDTLGGLGARYDAIGAWVALDVHGIDLAPLCPVPGGPVWHPRRRRGLFFDRTVHRVPEVIIPYRTAAALVDAIPPDAMPPDAVPLDATGGP